MTLLKLRNYGCKESGDPLQFSHTIFTNKMLTEHSHLERVLEGIRTLKLCSPTILTWNRVSPSRNNCDSSVTIYINYGNFTRALCYYWRMRHFKWSKNLDVMAIIKYSPSESLECLCYSPKNVVSFCPKFISSGFLYLTARLFPFLRLIRRGRRGTPPNSVTA